ncbi:hypothetical protein FRB90_007799 [Tulasnella sp. 427]|nr:hypothetical protein FRB90_007799 [Tulasnella sp. 427]
MSRDEDEDDGFDDMSRRMGRLSVSSSSTQIRMCIVCKEMPAVGSHQYCSKSCKEDHSDAGVSRQSVSPRRRTEDEDYDRPKRQDRQKTLARTSTALARRPPMCMNCRRNPKVDGSEFCGPRCMRDAIEELQTQANPSGRGKKRRDSQQFYSYSNRAPGYNAPPQTSTWYTVGYAPGYNQGYGGYPQQQQSFGPQQQYPQPPYPTSPQYYNPTPWPMNPPAPSECFGHPVPGRPDVTSMQLVLHAQYRVAKAYHMGSLDTAGRPVARTPSSKASNQDVYSSDPKYADIVQQFNATWTGGYGYGAVGLLATAAKPANPTIKRICKVVNSKAVETRYQTYRKQIEAKGNFAAQGKPEGNEHRRWHGTHRACTVGDTANNLTLCVNAACRLCSIIRVSFQTSSSVCASSGIYTSAFSGVSNGYTGAATPGSPYKAMFLARVVVGKKHVGGEL